jgi:hypothetical protein
MVPWEAPVRNGKDYRRNNASRSGAWTDSSRLFRTTIGGKERCGEIKGTEPLRMLPALRGSNTDFKTPFPRRPLVQSVRDTALRSGQLLARVFLAECVHQCRDPMGAKSYNPLALVAGDNGDNGGQRGRQRGQTGRFPHPRLGP